MSDAGLRVLCLSNMYPGPGAPDFGAFVATMCAALEREGASVRRAVIDTRAHGLLRTPAKYAGLSARAARTTAWAEVVYGHFLFPTGAIARLCGAALRRPYVVTAHGRDVRNLERRAIRALTAPVVRDAAAVVAVSRYLADGLATAGMAPRRLVVANMGVDMGRFAPAERGAARVRLGLAPEGELLLCVGGLTERKNPLVALQALALLRDRRPHARLALVGDGPLAGAVAAGAARLAIEDAVVLPGAVDHAQVADWMAACDVLLLPSRVEPLGIVALEALASGRPVVATRVGGVGEVLAPDVGAVVDPRDPRELARAAAELLDASPSAVACRRVAEGHDVRLQARTVLGVLAEAAGRPA